MKHILIAFILVVSLTSCGTSKRTVAHTTSDITSRNAIRGKTVIENAASAKKIVPGEALKAGESRRVLDNVIEYALTFEGTRYKFGGTTTAGMDCSGLVFTAFQKENIELPRISRDMASKGVLISFKDTEEGDLVFFKTNSRKNSINHVGIVVEAGREIKFIHASTSAGVIISSLDEDYWKKAFVEVRRII